MTRANLMSKPLSLLRQFSDEIVALAEQIVQSTASVTGQTSDFRECTGSAWLYDAEHLVTNNHVVENLVDPIHVQLPGGGATQAWVIGKDPLTDLAVLRADPQSAPPLRISQEGARLGELCFAFGCPLGRYPESLSIGIVSGLKRSISAGDRQSIFDVIQTDAAINPGNSGGPLVNTEGLVIGVNTEIDTEAEWGIGFAIPGETVAQVVSELITYGTVERASLGVTVARKPVSGVPTGHALVVTALRNNPAGPLLEGDVLLTVAGREIATQNDLLRALRRDVANRRIQVMVLRDGQEIMVECLPRAMRSYG